MARPQAVRTRIGRRVVALGSLTGMLLLLAAAVAAPAQGAPGDLDLTFSGDGKQTTDFRLAFASAAAIVRQPDGKKVAVGSIGGNDFALARYNSDGSLDTSFSGDGKQTTDFGTSFDDARGAGLQGDGKIVAVGATGDGGFALARYNPNGTLDTSFSGDGKQTTDFSGGFQEGARGVALQGDGKIVVVGAGNPFPGDFALARYNPNGTLDTSFSGDGKQTTDFGDFDQATGVAVQGDGKIVAVGDAGFGDFVLARYNSNGSLDTTFSGDGKQTTDFGGNFGEGVTGVALQANAKIVAVGQVGFSDFALARYNPNGSLDTTFSGDGKQMTDFGTDGDGATGVALQGDGKIVAVGRTGGDDGDFALARYNSNGSLDTTFSGDGKQTTDFLGDGDGANAVALQANAKIVVAGTCAGCDFALARYNSDGSLDTTFSGDGKQTTGFGGVGFDDAARGVALQGDGRIVAVGGFGPGGFGLTRYSPSGSLDTTFSGDGMQRARFPAAENEANAVALQANGKIVAVGYSRDLHFGAFALARYNPSGTLDTTFSGDGKLTTDFGGTSYGDDGATGVAVQGDGKIVVVGFAGFCDFALARYNPNGSLDTTFSGDGIQRTAFAGCGEGARGVAVQGDGKIVVVGAGGAGREFALARYNPNGTLDTSFSGDGKQTTDFGGFDGATGVALQASKIVAVGLAGGGPTGDFALARYNPNGTLDTSFSGDGKQTTDFGFGASDGANGIVVQGDGKIVAVGLAGGGPTNDDFAIARYNTNGSLDLGFSGDGRRRTNFGGSDEAAGVALQADGKIIAVGRGLGASGTNDFALARYIGG